MNNRIQLLLIIAAVQLLIVGFFLIADGQDSDAQGPWISIDREAVASIEIADADESVVLNAGDDGWKVDGLPADEDKITNVLDKLVELEAPWPVATSSDAIERFEVGDDNFQRQVVVSDGDSPPLDLYLGTSPGYQRVHARKASESDVFSVALSNYELPTNTDGWLDKALLTVSGDPMRIAAKVADSETVLVKGDEGWLVNGSAADQDAATTYANRFKTMRVLGIYGGDKALVSQGVIRIGEPAELELEILREAAAEETIEDLREKEVEEETEEEAAEQEGEYVVRSPAFDRTFRLSTYIAEQLLMTDVDFTAAQETPEEETPEETQDVEGSAPTEG